MLDRKKGYQRERRIICGETRDKAEYQEIYIYPMSDTRLGRERDRRVTKPRNMSSEAQQKANARRARRHLIQLIATNFRPWIDTHTVLTYADEYLPADDAQAKRDIDNWVRHLTAACKKQGLAKPEYIIVTENQEADPAEGKKAVRYHHHAILRCDLTRDEIETAWNRNGVRLGTANADRLQWERCSPERLALYITKYANRKHRWKQSRGLKQPITPRPNDTRYTRHKVERIAKDSGKLHDPDYWRRIYPGWELNEAEAVYNDYDGWHILLKMRRDRHDIRAGGGPAPAVPAGSGGRGGTGGRRRAAAGPG